MPLPTPFYLRTNQNTPLTYGQLDGNFTILNTKIDNTTLSNVGVGIGIFKNKDVNANSGTMNVYSLSGTNGVNISISDETILIAGGGTFTGNTSGSCITDLYVSNLYGCSPITLHDEIKSYSGGSQLDLRADGLDSNISITTDNGGYTESWLYLEPTYAQLSYGFLLNQGGSLLVDNTNAKLFADTNNMAGPNSSMGFIGTRECGIAEETNVVIGSIFVVDVTTSNKTPILGLDNVGVHINTNNSTTNLGVDHSVILGGDNITVKTNDTAYANKISLQPSGNTFDGMLIPPNLTADRSYTFQDASGTVAFLSDITPFTGNTSGSCISDLYITNLYGCSPITIHDSIEHNGSTASGLLSVSLGDLTEASGDYSFAIGRQTVSSGLRSYSEGNRTGASNTNSHAEGNLTNASGENSHAEGNATIASGDESHAEGNTTTASGLSSHAEGFNTTASGDYSHAQGQSTTASGDNSHAQGQSTTASGNGSHAEGVNTIASGLASHAGGYSSILNGYVVASGTSSFAHFYIDSASGSRGAYGDYSAILGGVDNNIQSASTHSVILGGSGNFTNIATTNGQYSAIIAGEGNRISGDYSGIFGGVDNRCSGLYSAVIGSSGITATRNNTVYVPDLIINGLTSVTDLQTNADGLIIDGASDITLKDNIEELSNALEKIISLNPVSFEWKEEMKLREGKVFGLIAQEVEKIIPQIVRERANGDGTLTVEYKELIPWIISAIQELVENYKLAKVSPENSNIVPQYTPDSTDDLFGRVGTMTRDDNYLYIKGSDGWRRSKLEKF